MRYLVCLIVGLVFGAIAASMVVNTVARRHAWPRGVMNVMQHELSTARRAAHANQCAPAAAESAHRHLTLLATDIEAALLPNGAKDRVFTQYAQGLERAIADWDPAAACAAQTTALTRIAQACDDCHRDYR